MTCRAALMRTYGLKAYEWSGRAVLARPSVQPGHEIQEHHVCVNYMISIIILIICTIFQGRAGMLS